MPRRVGARSPRGAARLPPRADPGPAGVPGSAGAAGGLRPQDSAEEPAKPGPGGLARGAQPLTHGPRAGAARRAPSCAPSRQLYSGGRPQPPPRGGASRKSCLDSASPTPGRGPKCCCPKSPIPSGPQREYTGKSVCRIPLDFLWAKTPRQAPLDLDWLFAMKGQ